MSSTLDRRLPPHPARTMPLVLGVLVAALASLLANSGIALAAMSTHPSVQMGLSFAHYAPLTVVGVLAGTAGWALIRRNTRRPRVALSVVVPVVVVVSFVPDLVLLLATSTTAVNVVALLSMHLAIAAITVPILGRVLPLPVEPPAHRD